MTIVVRVVSRSLVSIFSMSKQHFRKLNAFNFYTISVIVVFYFSFSSLIFLSSARPNDDSTNQYISFMVRIKTIFTIRAIRSVSILEFNFASNSTFALIFPLTIDCNQGCEKLMIRSFIDQFLLLVIDAKNYFRRFFLLIFQLDRLVEIFFDIIVVFEYIAQQLTYLRAQSLG